MSTVRNTVREARQLYLFDEPEITELNANMWHGSFNGRESTLQQLSPYVGKMKSGMARSLVRLYSRPGDVVLDPFAGSGTTNLAALETERHSIGVEIEPKYLDIIERRMRVPLGGTSVQLVRELPPPVPTATAAA